MDYKNIQVLLDKYWEGATSLEEEKQLREYFTQHDVHDSLKIYQNLFQFYQQEANLQSDRDFEVLLEEKTAPVVRMRPLRRWMQVAASIAVVIAVYWFWPSQAVSPQKQAINWAKYEIKEEKEALRFVTQTLKLTSSKLRKGTQTAAEGISKVKSATNRVVR